MLHLLNDLVRNITIVVLMACFLEMLLPQGKLKKFVKVVLGFFILVSILNPVLNIFDQKTIHGVLAWQDPMVNQMEINRILKRGDNLSREITEETLNTYQENLAKQIEALVQLVPGVNWVEAKIMMESSEGEYQSVNIEKIHLKLGVGIDEEVIIDRNKGSTKINPITIDLDNLEEKAQNNTIDEIDEKSQGIIKMVEETLVGYFGFKREEIEVEIIKDLREDDQIE